MTELIWIDYVTILGLKEISIKKRKVCKHNYKFERRELEKEKRKIIDYFKQYKMDGLIKGISKPKNWTIQKDLDILIGANKMIDYNIFKIKEMFYK